MSRKGFDRLEVIRRVASKRLRRKQAACQLVLSIRRIKRWVRRYREQGPTGSGSHLTGYLTERNYHNSAIPLNGPLFLLFFPHSSYFKPRSATGR